MDRFGTEPGSARLGQLDVTPNKTASARLFQYINQFRRTTVINAIWHAYSTRSDWLSLALQLSCVSSRLPTHSCTSASQILNVLTERAERQTEWIIVPLASFQFDVDSAVGQSAYRNSLSSHIYACFRFCGEVAQLLKHWFSHGRLIGNCKHIIYFPGSRVKERMNTAETNPG